ncbi:MAG TPA: SRPBCC family protein [Solirubrobacteraceae bacterium]|nr:SRPBCC family protein [Solirubrobacteraceae bacterium]
MTEVAALVYRVRIAAPCAAVFDHFVDPERLLRWIGVAAELDPRPGGRLRIDVNGRDVVRGAFVEVAPPHRVAFTWGWDAPEAAVGPGASLVEVTLTADGASTRLELRHSGLPAPAGPVHDAGWRHYVPRLATAAGGGDPGGDPMATPRTRHGTPS